MLYVISQIIEHLLIKAFDAQDSNNLAFKSSF